MQYQVKVRGQLVPSFKTHSPARARIFVKHNFASAYAANEYAVVAEREPLAGGINSSVGATVRLVRP